MPIVGEVRDYTLERDNRELQLRLFNSALSTYYTLERDNRELQLSVTACLR